MASVLSFARVPVDEAAALLCDAASLTYAFMFSSFISIGILKSFKATVKKIRFR